MYHWIVQVVLKLKRLDHTLAIAENRASASPSEVWQLLLMILMHPWYREAI